MEKYRSFQPLLLSPSQWPEYIPWLGKVEREMMKGLFGMIRFRALDNSSQVSGKASEELVRLLLALLLPGGRFGFHQAVEAVQVIVRGQLLLRAGAQSFGFQRAPEDTCKKRVPS